MYETYTVWVHDKCVYVGRGVTGRHKHATSGTSHCYELNKHHFLNDKVDVEVTPHKTKSDSVKTELNLISLFNPPYNVLDKVVNRWSKTSKRRLKQSGNPNIGKLAKTFDSKHTANGRKQHVEKAKSRNDKVIKFIDVAKQSGCTSLREIAVYLNENHITTSRGGQWSATQVSRVIQQTY